MRRIACALGGIVLATCCSQDIVAAESSGSSWWPWGHKDEAKPSTSAALGAGGSTPAATSQTGSGYGATSPQSGETYETTTPETSGMYGAAGPRSGGTYGTATPSTGNPYAVTTPVPAQPPGDHVEKERWMLDSPKGKVSWPRLSNPFASTAKKEEVDTRNSWVEKTPEKPKPSPLKPITDGAHKVATGTKNAWHKTVDALTPGPSKTETASRPAPRIAKREVDPPFWKRMLGAKQPEPEQPKTIPQWMAQQRIDP